jgi:hypothetical protein
VTCGAGAGEETAETGYVLFVFCFERAEQPLGRNDAKKASAAIYYSDGSRSDASRPRRDGLEVLVGSRDEWFIANQSPQRCIVPRRCEALE